MNNVIISWYSKIKSIKICSCVQLSNSEGINSCIAPTKEFIHFNNVIISWYSKIKSIKICSCVYTVILLQATTLGLSSSLLQRYTDSCRPQK